MIDDSMRIQLLPEYLIISDYIKGIDNCNYENYLIELINHSSYFLDLGQSKYVKPISESNGENDAIADAYSLDFKLAASTSMLRGKSLLSPQIYTKHGVTIHSIPRVLNGQEKCVLLHTSLRGKTVEELCEIRNNKNKKIDFIEKDIKSFLKVLSTQKNIVLFYPCKFLFDINYNFNDCISKIKEGIEFDFKSAFEYRNHLTDKDTFFSCIFDEQLIIFKYANGLLVFIDKIPLLKSKIYQELSNYKMW